MYDYKEVVRNDVEEWMTENHDTWADEDRSSAYEIIYDGCWADDSVTGNGSGSYTMNRYDARRNFMDDWEADEYIAQMLEDGFIDAETLGRKIAESNWEWVDVNIRCWLLSDAVNHVLEKCYPED